MRAIERIYATVKLQPPVAWQAVRECAGQHPESFPGPDWLLDDDDDDMLRVDVGLAAQDDAGRRIKAEGGFGLGGPRRGIAANRHRDRRPLLMRLLHWPYRPAKRHRRRLNQMLGRDPTMHRPPRLAWGPLVAALSAEGVQMSELELIETPLTVELEQEVVAAMRKKRLPELPARVE